MYPNLKINPTNHWTEMRDEERLKYFIKTLARVWSETVRELQKELRGIKSLNGTQKKEIVSWQPREPGALHVYRRRKINGQTWIDLGFSNFLKPSHIKKKIKIVRDRAFTYEAEVEEVIDGDTLWCLVDLGFGVRTRQKLRLRGLNAAEIESWEGREAKRYLAHKLPKRTRILILTTKTDKFDRYVADLWLKGESVNEQLALSGRARVVAYR